MTVGAAMDFNADSGKGQSFRLGRGNVGRDQPRGLFGDQLGILEILSKTFSKIGSIVGSAFGFICKAIVRFQPLADVHQRPGRSFDFVLKAQPPR
ncbi:MAG: hypothetical protein AAGD23_13015 [Pseudomonadota bacterium]